MNAFNESTAEQATLAWMEAIGWRIAHGPDIAPDMPAAERSGYGEVVLARRLRDALARLNPALPTSSSPTRRIAASTTSSMASRATCAMPCRCRADRPGELRPSSPARAIALAWPADADAVAGRSPTALQRTK
jgi:hypothetical protein